MAIQLRASDDVSLARAGQLAAEILKGGLASMPRVTLVNIDAPAAVLREIVSEASIGCVHAACCSVAVCCNCSILGVAAMSLQYLQSFGLLHSCLPLMCTSRARRLRHGPLRVSFLPAFLRAAASSVCLCSM